MPNIKWHSQTVILRFNLAFVFTNESLAPMHAAIQDAQASHLASPLSHYPVGSQGTVAEVAGTGRFSARLREFGLLPGVRVRLLRAGSSVVVQIGETRLALRHCDAEAIRVCSDAAQAPSPATAPVA